MKQMSWLITFLIPVIACSVAVCANAQHNQDTYAASSTSTAEYEPDLKRPGWFFHHPKMDTPGEQITYADGLLSRGKTRKAGKQYLALVHEWHQSREAPEAQFSYAKTLYKRGKYRKAFEELQYLIDNFAGAFSYNEVLDLQFRIANYVLTDKAWDILFFSGFERPERALPFFEQIIDNAPNWSQTSDIRLKVGIINEETDEYETAIDAYEKVEIHHSHTDHAETAAFRKAVCLTVLANKSPRDEKLCRTALSSFTSFLATYENKDYRTEAKNQMIELKLRLADMYYTRAHFYDQIANRPKAAIIAYEDFLKQFPSSEKALTANARLEELEQQMRQSNEE